MSLHPREIHLGEIFYECGHQGNVKMKAITEPYEEKGAWTWKARNVKTKEVVDYIWTGYAYGPQLYDSPAYGGTDPHLPDYVPKGDVQVT